MQKFRVGILGATGAVGQRLVQLLEGHPWFEVAEVAASERSAGKSYADAADWRLDTPLPQMARDLIVKDLTPNLDCDFVFSGLDSSVAGVAEEEFARAGYPVISNSRNHRMDADVPLLIPEANPEHTGILPRQQAARKYTTGFMVTNPNCSAIGLALALKPLEDAFGVAEVFVVTMQAISGAGHSGVAAGAIHDNVIPYISGEEEKLEAEPQKILGKLEGRQFVPAGFSRQRALQPRSGDRRAHGSRFCAPEAKNFSRGSSRGILKVYGRATAAWIAFRAQTSNRCARRGRPAAAAP